MNISIILLAGGKGTRMGSTIPKVFLNLKGKPLILHSFDLFQSLPYTKEIVVVCEKKYRHIFPNNILFADPGKSRQDSVENGFHKTKYDTILVHDGARPFITEKDINTLLKKGLPNGIAALGVPLSDTVKQINPNGTVEKTLNRSQIYCIQTPQLLKRDVLKQGILAAKSAEITFNDDVSLAEYIGHPVKIIPGSPKNFKITFEKDLKLAEIL